MDLCEFEQQVYGKYNHRLFVFERDWGTFRPIQHVGWNGTRFEIVDSPYCDDIFDGYYGYGNSETKQLCDRLLRTTELESKVYICDPVEFWSWCSHINKTTWWRDRPILFTSNCVATDIDSWKKYLVHLKRRHKTLKREHRLRMITKRLLPR